MYSFESLSLKPMQGNRVMHLIVLVPYINSEMGAIHNWFNPEHKLEVMNEMIYVWIEKQTKMIGNALHWDERPLINGKPTPSCDPPLVDQCLTCNMRLSRG